MIASRSLASRSLALAAAALVLASAAQAQGGGREGPSEIRRILAEAICLAEAYPGSAVAADSGGLIAVYLEALGGRVGAREIEAVRELARSARPAEPTPVGGRNLAVARCVLFAGRPAVIRALGGRTAGR